LTPITVCIKQYKTHLMFLKLMFSVSNIQHQLYNYIPELNVLHLKLSSG